MSDLSIKRAPTISLSAGSSPVIRLNPNINASYGNVSSPIRANTGVNVAQAFTKSSAPGLSLPRPRLNIATPNLRIARPSLNIGVRTSSGTLNFSLGGSGTRIGIPTTPSGAVSAIANRLNVPTTIGGAAAFAANKLGIPTSLPPLNQALRTLGIPDMIKVSVGNLGLEFPKIPEFPGLDLIGIYLGAGPKYIAEKLAKYRLIIPPFLPGLKINMGMVLAAASVIQAIVKVGPGEILKHLLSQVAQDITGQIMEQVNDAIDKTGINDRIDQVKDQLGGILSGAQVQFEVDFRRNNPPETTYDEDGNAIVKEVPMAKSNIPSIDTFIPPNATSTNEATGLKNENFTSSTPTGGAYTNPPPTG